MEAVTTHTPAEVGVSLSPETLQGPETTWAETAPLPEPPIVTKSTGLPNSSDVDSLIENELCAFLLTNIFVLAV